MNETPTPDRLAEIKSRAEKFIAAYEVMIELDGGVGKLATERPDLMPDFDAWWETSDFHYADTALELLAATRPVTLPDRDELARELFIRDNARQGRAKSVEDFERLGGQTYAHYLADVAIEAFRKANS